MINKLTASILAATLTIPFLTPSVVEAKTVEKKIPVQFLGLNDLHGFIEGDNRTAPNGKRIGGMDSLAYNFQKEQTAFAKSNKLKSITSNSVLVQAGDIVGGSPAVSGLLQDQPTMKIMNAIGFQVGTLGNHEFDEGIEEFSRIYKGERPNIDTGNYENVLFYNQTKSKTSIVISNVVNKKSKKLLTGFKPYTIKKVGGVNVGYIGVVTPNISEIVAAEHMKNIDIIAPDKAIATYTKELRKKGVKAIVVVAHAGAAMNPNANTSIDTQKTSNVTGEVVSILKGVNKLDPNNSIDLVLSAHTHTYVNGTYKNVRIVQGLNYSNAYSKVTGTLSSKTKDFIKTPSAEIKYNYTVSTSTLRKNNVAKNVNNIIVDAKKRVASTINSPIATMTKDSLNSVPNEGEFGSELGNLVADAQLNMAIDKKYPTDFAFTNTGGIRTDLMGVKSGNHYNITWGAAQSVQPFNNFLQHVQMTGEQVRAVLNQQFNNGNRKLDVAGLHYTYNSKGVVDVFIGNGTEKIKEDTTYNVVINNFLSGGKDNYPSFTKATGLKTIAIDTDIFIEYLKKIGTYDAKYVSRATLVND